MTEATFVDILYAMLGVGTVFIIILAFQPLRKQ